MQDEDYTICDDLGGFENTTYRNEIVMIEIYTCTEEDKYIEEDWFSFNRRTVSMNGHNEVDALVKKNDNDNSEIWGYSTTIVNYTFKP